MSLCTWATVVSTVPSPSLHGVESRQIFGENGEPVPLPTFLSFLELLEELNREETEKSAAKEMKLFCQESFNSPSLSSSFSEEIDLDKFLDLEDLNEEEEDDIFEASSSMEVANLGSNSFSSTSEYFCSPDFFSEILPYESLCKNEDFESSLKSGLLVDRIFSDWSPELFEENIDLKNSFKDSGETKSVHEFPGETPLKNETTFKFPDEEIPKAAATSPHSGEAQEEAVKQKHKRKRKCTNCFDRQESRSPCKSFSTTCREFK